MRPWLNLALPALLLMPGCFASHVRDRRDDGADAGIGRRDAGGGIDDGGACEEVPSVVSELACPRIVGPGDAIAVTVTHSPASCCSPEGARTRLDARGPRELEITTWWDACSCCEACACDGPPESERIELGAFGVGWVSVVAGDQRCEIEVRESDCHSVQGDEVHAPLAIARGEDIPLLMRHHMGRGCGCVPEASVRFGREGGSAVGIELCDCSSEDPCVDPGYEVTALHPGRDDAGTVVIAIGGGAHREIAIVDPASCAPGPEVRGLRLAAPDESLQSDDPRGHWAVLSLEETYCCSTPTSLIERLESPSPFAIALLPRNCAPPEVDCDCAPGIEPTRWEHWHFLGQLAPGHYSVRAGAHAIELDVPR